MEDRSNFNNSCAFETFLNRAFQFDLRIPSASNQQFLNLINAENGNRLDFLPTRDKQFNEIQKQMRRAVNLFLKAKKINKVNNIKLEELLPSIDKATSSSDINNIVQIGLELTQSLI